MPPTIRLFLHQLAETSAQDSAPAETVAPDELARARRFHFDDDAWRWLAGRAWVRRTLGSVLARPPATIAFSLDPNGKPRVREAPPGFECNWSHSGDRIALAISDSAPVGVDLEVVRHDFPALEVAKQFFTPAETAALAQSHGPARQRLFLRLWTAKEALMKATGAGVSLSPDTIEVGLSNSLPTGYPTHPEWQLVACDTHHWAAAVTWPAQMACTVETIVS